MSVTGRHLENIDFNKDGGVLVVSSNLTGQVWDGGLNYFPDHTDIESKLYQTHLSKQMCVSAADGVWCSNDCVAVATDNGSVEILALEDGFFVDSCRLWGHHSYVTTLSVTCDSSYCVSGAADGCVNVSDLSESRLVTKYRIHSDVVNRVSTHNSSPNMFTSCSMDGTVLVYDTRKDKPAKKIAMTNDISTSACYHGDKVTVGTERGQLLVRDLRSTSMPLKEVHNHSRAVRRIAFSPERAGLIATCGEDGVVAVLSYDLLNTQSIYRSEIHKDIVTGLVWRSADELISCSWDSTIRRHTVSSAESLPNGHLESPSL